MFHNLYDMQKTKDIILKFHRKSWVDKAVYVAAILQPLMTIPQVIQIYSTHNVAGVSLVTWLAYAILGLAFLAYGIKYRLWPIAITQILWFVLQMSVVVGVFLYR